MLYSTLWIVMLVLLAIWSTGVWVLHSLLVWSISGVGALAGQAQQADSVTLPGWLLVWLPPEWMPALEATASSLLPWLESVLSMLPGVANWLSPLAWLVWALGLLMLAAVAAIGQALIWTTGRAART